MIGVFKSSNACFSSFIKEGILFKFLLKNSYDTFIKILETYANPELNYSKSYFNYAYAYFELSLKRNKYLNENG